MKMPGFSQRLIFRAVTLSLVSAMVKNSKTFQVLTGQNILIRGYFQWEWLNLIVIWSLWKIMDRSLKKVENLAFWCFILTNDSPRGGSGIFENINHPSSIPSGEELRPDNSASTAWGFSGNSRLSEDIIVNNHSFIKSWFFGMQQFSLNPATLKSFQLL